MVFSDARVRGKCRIRHYYGPPMAAAAVLHFQEQCLLAERQPSFTFLGSGKGGISDVLNNGFAHYLPLIFETHHFILLERVASPTQELDSMLVTVDSADETLKLTTNWLVGWYVWYYVTVLS